jgi:hypothetical protein
MPVVTDAGDARWSRAVSAAIDERTTVLPSQSRNGYCDTSAVGVALVDVEHPYQASAWRRVRLVDEPYSFGLAVNSAILARWASTRIRSFLASPTWS